MCYWGLVLRKLIKAAAIGCLMKEVGHEQGPILDKWKGNQTKSLFVREKNRRVNYAKL